MWACDYIGLCIITLQDTAFPLRSFFALMEGVTSHSCHLTPPPTVSAPDSCLYTGSELVLLARRASSTHTTLYASSADITAHSAWN